MSLDGHRPLDQRALVLGCHRVIATGPLKRGVDVSPLWLRNLAKLPYQFHTLGEALNDPVDGAMVLTFDDGDPTVGSEALPLLAEFGIEASAFVMPPMKAPAPSFWHELLAASWEIGSHSLTHRPLDLLDASESKKEIAESKLRLEDVLGIPIPGFAFPYGRFGPRELEFVCEAGYQYAVTTLPWIPFWWRLAGIRLVPRKMCDERTSMPEIQLVASSWSVRFASWLKDEANYRMHAALGTGASPLRVLPRD